MAHVQAGIRTSVALRTWMPVRVELGPALETLPDPENHKLSRRCPRLNSELKRYGPDLCMVECLVYLR